MLNADSLQIRRSAIAYLFANVIQMDRRDNLAFYDDILKKGLDYPEMQQRDRVLTLLRRTTPQQVSEVSVGALDVVPRGGAGPGMGPQPAGFRFLVAEQNSSKPLKFFQDAAETLYTVFDERWGERVGRFVLVEVSFIVNLSVDTAGGAKKMLHDAVLGSGNLAAEQLGRDFEFVGIKFGSGMSLALGPKPPSESLAGAQIDFTVETPPGNPTLLAVSLNAKWQALQLRLSDVAIPKEIRKSLGDNDFYETNTQAKPPNTYIDQVYQYLTRRVVPFLSTVGR